MSNRVLVTGNEGYIGSVLVPMLVDRGYEVVGLDTGYFTGCDLLDRSVDASPATSLHMDVRDVEVEQLRDIDAVLHLAALSNDPMGTLNPTLTDAINHQASVRLARVAKTAGVQRFIFSSSCSLYGASDTDVPLTEDAPFHPVTAYGESKVATELDVAPLADDTFSPVFLRNATAYGVAPRLRGDLVVQDLVASAMLTGEIEIRSDGTPWRPLVHVEDIARAFIATLEAPREAIHARAFNVGRSGENYQISDIARLVQNAVPGSTVAYAPGGGPDKRSYRVNFDRIAAALPGFEPQWTVAAGIEQVVQAYAESGIGLDDIRGERFTRLARLQRLMHENAVDSDLRWAARPAVVGGA